MKKDTFIKILDQIKPYTDHIYFHVKGEPLLHPELDVFLDISHEKGFRVNITTNGTLIHHTRKKLISKPALRLVNFSLHSFDGNQGNGSREDYMDRIFRFVREAMVQSKILISFRFWNLTQDNKVNLETDKNRHILEKIENEYGLDYKIQDMIAASRGLKLTERIYLNQDHEFVWPDLKEPEDEGMGFCHGLRNQAAILVDGTVVPCCLDGEGIMDLGNIHRNHFSEIITGDKAIRIYDGFSNRIAVEELCRKCGYRKRFGTKKE